MFTLLRTLAPIQRPYTVFVSACLSFIVLVLCAGFYQQQVSTITQQAVDHYGESLASLAADRIAATTLNQDPISLQAVVRAIANKKAVVSVVTYDIDNTILAQVDHKNDLPPKDMPQQRYYTAPVTVSNNLAGSITIGVNPSQFNKPINHSATWLLGLLLLITAGISYRRLTLSKHNTSPSQATPPHATADIIADSTEDSEQEDESLVILAIQITNTEVLYQQLNGEARNQQLQQFQQDIDHTAALYSANIIGITDNSIILSFKQISKDTLFNALCCGQLLLNLNRQRSKTLLNVAATVQCFATPYKLERILAKMCPGYHTHSNPLYVDSRLIEQYQLSHRITADALSAIGDEEKNNEDNIFVEFSVVTEFQEKYATLLNNQLAHLKKQ